MVPTFLLIIISIYVFVFLIDKFYKTCCHYPYIQFIKNTGLKISFFQIKWETTAFNRILLRWGSSHSNSMNLWFDVGLNVTLIFLPIACFALIFSIYQMFFARHASPSEALESSVIVPIIPGANLPTSDVSYYVISLFVSSIFHELGHALTAVKEDVRLTHIGVWTFFILPVVYVGLNSEDFLKLKPWKSLKILCAGIWHNITLSFFAYLIFLVLPFIFAPFYTKNQGVIVDDISNKSPLFGSNGLSIGSKIFFINGCNTDNLEGYFNCIQKFRNSKPGFCTLPEMISTHDETEFRHSTDSNCCNENRKGSLCFEYLENNNGILELPPHTCLPVRTVAELSKAFCNASSDCPSNTHCLKPMIKDNTNVFIIKTDHRDVVYLGLASDLYSTLTVSEYVPKYEFLSLDFPKNIEKVVKYIVIISLGLGVVNVIPLFTFDGHYISNTLIKLILGNRIDNQKLYSAVTLLVPFCGTLLFSSLVLRAIWIFVYNSIYN